MNERLDEVQTKEQPTLDDYETVLAEMKEAMLAKHPILLLMFQPEDDTVAMHSFGGMRAACALAIAFLRDAGVKTRVEFNIPQLPDEEGEEH